MNGSDRGRKTAEHRRGRVAAFAALATALAMLWMPVGLIETVVASSGVSEAVPATAPPLGMTARLTLAAFVGLMAAGVTQWMARAPVDAPHEEEEEARVSRAKGAKTMGFAFSKLTALARGRAAPVVSYDAPSLRRADAHPDAPPRPPIFASRDFDGLEIFARPDSGRAPVPAVRDDKAEVAEAVEQPAAGPAFLRPAFATPAVDMDEAEVTREPILEEAQPWTPQASVPVEEPLTPLPLRMPTHDLSVRELTERLERGLAMRSRTATAPSREGGVIADMPPARRVPVRDRVAPDTDEALRAALGALRSMAGRR